MPQAVIAIHGGAGTITRAAMDANREREYTVALEQVLLAGQRVLAEGGSALDAVTEAVRLLEECPLFNAGKGAVLTHAGTYELDASVMDGATLNAGAVACVKRLRNPVLAARAVLEKSEHVLFAGEGAEAFAEAQGLELVAPEYYFTQARYDQWQRAQGTTGMALLDHDAAALAARAAQEGKADPLDADKKFGTVGAVACDANGNLAAATSTGGVTNKQVGRVGDTPVLGAGCYADDVAAVSATGTGEMFIRTAAAFDVSAQMRYAGLSLEESARRVVMEKLPAIHGRGGLIAVDRAGNVTLPFNTEGMYRGLARVGEPVNVWIYG
ncbi:MULTISPECIES: isoaspartyl peptidase/L-asparaginase [unclassified Cupriavidus]|jgi:L-asparaginase / beta-aspartyl-peptidase|uniref:isoaspartyl peptidase/L-asparaginase family protein n=1 Tax=unclassified Cupriavidus TaxID=2640874 RepID=UPI001C004C30|nr:MULTISPECIES: isoaspartyl peptidase/L-asparaginase [unclassified Cupriavidus]MCA3189742.1 isoaspartyl peptidase/L-asparaginase [Cupriavidus sp.]MCA3196336.1 isoaspartyl peptidase/L-asparaginase [Cupriavidus sp.]MCA3202081.1 isoaspartyl peptidase/L-asparaginase [Cupriavidus sp.]MCA3207078.1 isoaspartyl peptidase/L-asparaginase [Cupriavidus sp.]MCA3233872.1 isoaspartyl peptidase/L-asparaginase [Cupriavidus sp.]